MTARLPTRDEILDGLDRGSITRTQARDALNHIGAPAEEILALWEMDIAQINVPRGTPTSTEGTKE